MASSVTVDDDNEPAPENTPVSGEAPQDVMEPKWGRPNICHRRRNVTFNEPPRIRSVSNEVTPTFLQMFELFFPKLFVETIMFPIMNGNLSNPIDWGEFLVFIGIWFALATVQSASTRREFWSSKPVEFLSGALFCLEKYMTRNRFENILQVLVYTNHKAPPYVWYSGMCLGAT